MVKLAPFIFLLLNCQTQGRLKEIQISLKNETSHSLEKVEISVLTSKITFRQINSGLSSTNKLTIRIDSAVNYEGAFLINITSGDSLKKSGTFGYYSSLRELKNNYTITVFDDLKFRESH